jgi:hypothetical protein
MIVIDERDGVDVGRCTSGRDGHSDRTPPGASILSLKGLLRWQTRVDILRYVPRPNVAVAICDASSTLGYGYVAVQRGRIVDNADGT